MKANYDPIPMSQIREEPRNISIAWHESATNWIGDKVKLASDIQNYANWYARQVAEAIISEACYRSNDENRGNINEIDIEKFIK